MVVWTVELAFIKRSGSSANQQISDSEVTTKVFLNNENSVNEETTIGSFVS